MQAEFKEHFGLRLPGTLSSFGNVPSGSVSNWAADALCIALNLVEPRAAVLEARRRTASPREAHGLWT